MDFFFCTKITFTPWYWKLGNKVWRDCFSWQHEKSDNWPFFPLFFFARQLRSKLPTPPQKNRKIAPSERKNEKLKRELPLIFPHFHEEQSSQFLFLDFQKKDSARFRSRNVLLLAGTSSYQFDRLFLLFDFRTPARQCNHYQRKPVLPPAKGVPTRHPNTDTYMHAFWSMVIFEVGVRGMAVRVLLYTL